MKIRVSISILALLVLLLIVGCETIPQIDEAPKVQEPEVISENEESELIDEPEDIEEEISAEPAHDDVIVGPGGCIGDECDEYFANNFEESMKWCDENPVTCQKLQGDDVDPVGPGGCGENCEEYCNINEQECNDWCTTNLDKHPELCEYILQEESEGRNGDGVWEKDELTFYIKDEEGVLTDEKRQIIVETIASTKEGNGGYYGWNTALAELNRLYPDNIVPDKMIETDSEENADFVLAVHSVKEFCCDLTGDPIVGREMSDIDDNSAKIRSNIDAYNIINIDIGFLEDMMRHEIGHGLGLFGHVVDRQNDLMSIVSPASVIKLGNLDDLYVKYRDRIIQTVEETRQMDESVADDKVGPPS